MELTAELDAFHRGAATYADVLGSAGLAEYRRLSNPNETAQQRVTNGRVDYGIREAMIGVALASGDPGELIEV